jgi:hypothetical protein
VNNVTVLSGDITQDDTIDPDGVVVTATDIVSPNVYHVMVGIGVSSTAVVDGFTITAGQGDGDEFPDNLAGGFLCQSFAPDRICSPVFENVIYSGNKANFGGAVMNLANISGANSSPTFRNVFFFGNSAGSTAGAMYNYAIDGGITSPRLENVVFSGNGAGSFAGAMANQGGDGGISSPRLTNVLFSGNSAENAGALVNGADDGTSNPLLTNVTVSGNYAKEVGGAVVNEVLDTGVCNPIIQNSILWHNLDNSGAGTISSTLVNRGAVISITNSVVQGAGDSGAGIWITDPAFNDEGGNIDKDPLFLVQFNPNPTPTTVGDYRLKENSPAIDVGKNIFISGFATDLDSNPRVVDGNMDGIYTVDMGAYEFLPPHPYGYYLPLVFSQP